MDSANWILVNHPTEFLFTETFISVGITSITNCYFLTATIANTVTTKIFFITIIANFELLFIMKLFATQTISNTFSTNYNFIHMNTLHAHIYSMYILYYISNLVYKYMSRILVLH